MTELLLIGGFAVAWYLLNLWILPRLGIST